ncbi:DUF4810 domain-containing protein [Yeosuana sp. AK3]
MKKTFILFIALLLTVSCTTQKPLYTWGDYNNTTYKFLKKSDEKATQNLIESYEKIINNQKGLREVPPPGIYADYGFLLLQIEQTQKGKEMLDKEIALYPESQIFIERILKMLEI